MAERRDKAPGGGAAPVPPARRRLPTPGNPSISSPMTELSRIRNFSIVAHIDHGKSTLADRLIQLTGTVAERDMKEQMLDAMDIERERGITIKANTVRIDYPAKDGHTYVAESHRHAGPCRTFGYEVSRSMQAVEGSLLVVDASQGVEAQTLANVYQAIDADHEIVPVLKQGRPARRRTRPCPPADRGRDRHRGPRRGGNLRETGLGIPDVLEAIVTRLPPPKSGDRDAPLEGHAGRFEIRTVSRRHLHRAHHRRLP